MAMKILFVNPYIVSTMPTSLSEPIGIISLATYLSSQFGNDVSIDVLDLYALGNGKVRNEDNKYVMGMNDEEELTKKINAYEPDLIGIQCNFSMYSEGTFEITTLVKKICPEALVVMGGGHASLDAENIMKKYPEIDFIIRGEGEVVLTRLTSLIKDNQLEELNNVNGLCYRGPDNTIIINPEQELLPELDRLPMPDRKFIDMEFYKRINRQTFPFSKKTPVVTMMTSRGCPFDCIFCSTKTMWKRQWRPVSVENVIEEIRYLVKNYGAKEISILDDQFFLDKERVHKLCDYIIEESFKISLSVAGGGSIWLIDEPLMRKLKQAGFYRLNFPIETGNLNTQKFIRKPIDLEDAKEKIRLANSLGIWTAGNFIIGFPYETKEEMMDTINFAYGSKLDFSLFLIAKPFAGSEMTEIFRKEELLEDQPCISDLLISTHDTTTMTASELQQIHRAAVRGSIFNKVLFLLNPFNICAHIWPKLNTLDGIQYAIKLFVVSVFRVLIPGLMDRTIKLTGSIK